MARLMPYMEGSTLYTAMNFSMGYWEASGSNFTGASAAVNIFICPSAARDNPQRDGADPSDTVSTAFGVGYGYCDYGATYYVDISPILSTAGSGGGVGTPTPYRDKTTRANGLLKQGKTAIAEVTDGLSNTIAIGEDAGRDEYFLSPYTETPAATATKPLLAAATRRGLGPYSAAAARRYWRWAEPDIGLRRLGPAEQQVPPDEGAEPLQRLPRHPRHRRQQRRRQRRALLVPLAAASTASSATATWPSSRTRSTSSPSAAIVTPTGGEVVSADQY